MLSKTFTSASSALSTFLVIDDVPASKRGGPQFCRVFANGNHASGSATLTLALVNAGVVVWSTTATVTAGARRTAADNGSGNYISAVAFTESGTSVADLLGSEPAPGGGRSGLGLTTLDDSGYVWAIGCTSITNFTSLVVKVVTSYDAR
jgi:hypothetical protein